MNLAKNIRRSVYKAMLLPPINYIGRNILRLLPESSIARGRYIFPLTGMIPIDYDNYGSFLMNSDGADTIASRAYFSGALNYESLTAKALTALFTESQCFFDVGANTGICSLMAAKHPNIKNIYSFEPVPQIFTYLEKNIRSNNFTKIDAHLLALSNQSGQLSFSIPRGIVLPLGASFGAEKDFKGADIEQVMVNTETIDYFIAKNNTPLPDTIKIDTETTEPEVILGALSTIRTKRPSLVVEILTQPVGHKIAELLSDIDYIYAHLAHDGLVETKSIVPDPEAKDLNYVMIPKEKYQNFKNRYLALIQNKA